MEISALQAITNENQEAEVLVRGIFYKLQEKGAHNIFKKPTKQISAKLKFKHY